MPFVGALAFCRKIHLLFSSISSTLVGKMSMKGLQGGGSEPAAAAALLGLWLARDKDAPCAGEGTAVHGARCALNVQLGLAGSY